MEYDNLVGCYPAYKNFTLDEFMWASNIVLTRVFGVELANKRHSIVLVPWVRASAVFVSMIAAPPHPSSRPLPPLYRRPICSTTSFR
jgi:hypothetical protein